MATSVSIYSIEKLGRRVLLIASSFLMALSTFGLGLYFHFHEMESSSSNGGWDWLPLACLVSFVVAFSFGYGPVPWIMVVELFPREAREAMSSTALTFGWVFMYVVSKSTPILGELIHQSGIYFVFTGASVFGLMFTLCVVPETKGKTPEDMKAYFQGLPSSSCSQGQIPEGKS